MSLCTLAILLLSNRPFFTPQKVQVRANAEQKAALEAAFTENNKPSVQQRNALADQLNLPAKYLENWFATRRQKEKKRGTEGDAGAAAGASGDAAAAAEGGQEKQAKRPKVAHTPVPADEAACEQLGQKLAAEQAQLTEVFAAEQTLEPLNLLEGSLAEGDALKSAVRLALRVLPDGTGRARGNLRGTVSVHENPQPR